MSSRPIKLTYDDCWIKAEEFLIDGLTREAFYYYEEAYLIAKKDDNSIKKQEVLLKISTLLNSYKEYFYSRALYDFIFYGLTFRTAFSCNSSTSCCTKFRVDVDIYDIIRILDNNPSLKKEDFLVNYDKNKYFKDDINNLSLEKVDNQKLTLKKKIGKEDCFFLENSLCQIHDYKPFVCINWPMYIDDNNNISFSHMESDFIKKNCNYTLESSSNYKKEFLIKKRLKEFKYNRFYTSHLYENIIKQNKEVSFENYIDLIENKARNTNKLLEDICNQLIISFDISYIKLIVSQENKNSNDINLFVKTKSLSDNDFDKFLSINEKNVVFVDKNNYLVKLERNNLSILIEFCNEDKNYIIEKIIYGEELPKYKNNIDVDLDEKTVYQLLKASILVLTFLKRKRDLNEQEIIDLFSNINLLKEDFYKYPSLSYLFDFIYLNELIFSKSDKDSIYDFIEKCSLKYPSKSIKFELEKVNLISEENEINIYLKILIVKNKNDLKIIKKIFFYFKNTDYIQFNDLFNLNILLDLSNELVNQKDFLSLIKLLDSKIGSIELNANSYQIFYNLSISYLRLGRYKDSLIILEQLKNKFPRNLELLISIGDELYSEELYQEAVEYLNLSLDLITYKSNPQEFNIICEILLEIFINQNQISKAKKILSLWKKSNVKEVDKTVSISLFEIKLLTSKEKDRLLNNLFDKKNISYLEFYILSKINNKFITLPLDISVLKNKLLNTKVNAKVNKEITIKIFNKIHELFYLSAKSTILDKILKLKDDFKILFLKYFIYEELKDYNSASICLDKIDSYYDTFLLKDNEINLIILLLRAFIKDFSLDYKASLELYSSIFKLDLKPEYVDIVNTLHSNILLKLQFDKKEFNLLQKEISLLIKSLEKNNNQQTILHEGA